MTEAAPSPRNPYLSFIVSASAGSGKTYQLSRRFLCLVGAGAQPGEILTVTFTRKAAGEMRARILQEASRLLSDAKAQAAFRAELAGYHAADGRGLAPPRTPEATARAILETSQALKIMTIDSVFLEWVSKFTYEASGAAAGDGGAATGGEGAELPAPFELLDPFEEEELDSQAWGAACAVLARGIDSGNDYFARLLAALPKGSVLAARRPLDRLAASRTALWYEERRRGGAVSAHELPLDYEGVELTAPETTARLMDELAPALTAVIGVTGNDALRGRVAAAVAARDFTALLATPLITKTGTISKTYVNAARRGPVEREAASIETGLRRFLNARQLAALNEQGESLYAIYRMQRAALAYLKRSAGSIGFSDLAQGAYRLFHQDAGLGVRFLLARTLRHLMLDEFQDTSRLQWSVFAALAAELTAGDDLAGPGELRGSVFIVGDAKQSIYGFREADPSVMADAVTRFAGRAAVTTLAKSYRTAQVVLDFVNEAFANEALPDFSAHATAATEAGEPVIPDAGRVLVAPLLEDDPEGQTAARSGPEKEATLVADTLAAALGLSAETLACPVFDKDRKAFRPLNAGDCAILYRSGGHAELFEEALRARGIPCHKEEQHGFFARPEVCDALSLARFLCIPADLPALLAVLRSPLGRLGDEALLGLLARTATQSPAERVKSVMSGLAAVAPALAATLARAQARVGAEPLNAVLDATLEALDAEAAYSDALVNDAAEGLLARQNLRRLVEICLSVETGATPSPTALLAELERLTGRNETGNAPGQGGSVTLMTIHKSKGLEFPLVALVDTARPWAQRDPYWLTAETPDGEGRTFHYVGTRDAAPVEDPVFDRLREDFEAGTRAECMRLLYVAMTRARQYLLVTGHRPERAKGLEGTVFYGHLSACLSATRRPLPVPIGGVTLSAWSSAPDPAAVPVAAAPARAEAEGPLLAGLVNEADERARRLPAELEIVSPSASHGADQAGDGVDAGPGFALDAGVPSEDAALFGTLVHTGLQAWLERRPFDPAAAWGALAPGRAPPDWFPLAAEQVHGAAEDPTWSAWIAAGTRIDCELPLVHRFGDQLIQGAADAVVFAAPGEIQVIDFKTTLVRRGTVPTPAALAAFCRRRGFNDQLGAYARALRAIHPEARVTGLIYFVALRTFLPLEV